MVRMGIPSESTRGPDAERLRELVVDVLEGIERDGAGALESACREHPHLAVRLRDRIAALSELGLVGASPQGHPERVGEFRLVERIGVGGMGVVYRAVQESLDREVALKLIRPDVLHQPEARLRFARETAIIASLQHPGIVPIYTVGDDDELPWYAMEHVPGCTLAEARADLAGRTPEELEGADLWRVVCGRASLPTDGKPAALFDGTWEATCLRVVRQVADALDHAHARGVLHRDLKPSNVMVTPEGRVMLVDFGLSSSEEGGESLTRTGDRVGSLPYMPPELLRDGPRALDRKSDVYALGVTLYELLTLKLPFPGESVPARMAKILEGRPVRPRSHAPGIAWEAETVCLAAMDCDPRRRYASAGDFARDLDNALERRPVEARRASALLLTWRFVQRRPGAAAAIVLAVLLPTVVAALNARESRNVSAALETARGEKQRAEQNFKRSVHAIEAMLHNLAETDLDNVPGMDEVRRRVLDDAEELYTDLLAERPDDLDLVLLAVECEFMQAELNSRANTTVESESDLRRALTWLEPWREGPYVARKARAGCFIHLGTAAGRAGKGKEFLALNREAVAILRELVAERPDDPEASGSLVEALCRTVTAMRGTAEHESALEELPELEDLARSLIGDRSEPRALSTLARVLEIRGAWAYQDGRAGDSIGYTEEAVELYARAAQALPAEEDIRFRLAQVAADLASAQATVGDIEASLATARMAAEEIERVLEDYPGVNRFEDLAGTTQLNLGISLSMAGLREEARIALERSISVHGALFAEDAQRVYLLRSMGTAYLNLASVEHDLGDVERALDTCVRAREHLEAAVANQPDNDDWRSWLALERRTRAGLLLELGLPAQATEAMIGVEHLAAHRVDRLRSCLKRLARCLDGARMSGDAEVRRRSEEATRIIVEGAFARGDMESDAVLLALAAKLESPR